MSSNTNNKDKKNKPLSASSLCKAASKYTTRSQTADKGANYRQTRNPGKHTIDIMDQNRTYCRRIIGFPDIFTLNSFHG